MATRLAKWFSLTHTHKHTQTHTHTRTHARTCTHTQTLTPMTWVPGSMPAVAELNVKDLSNIRLRINPKVLKRVILKRQHLQPEKAKLPIALYPEPVLQPSTQSMVTYL